MTSQPDETIRKLNALTQILGVDAIQRQQDELMRSAPALFCEVQPLA